MDLPPQDIGYSPQSDIDAFIENLRAAVMRRVENVPAQPAQYVSPHPQKDDAKIVESRE
jgi:hypothetical protein